MKIEILECEKHVVLCRADGKEDIFCRELVNEKYALDPMASSEGNMLVENKENDLCFEICSDALLRFDGDCVIAITGADYSVSVNGESLPHYCAAQIDAFDEVRIKKNVGGCLYIAVNGNVESSERVLSAGSSVQISDNNENLYNMDLRIMSKPQTTTNAVIRLLPGAYADQYGAHMLELLYTTEFTVKSTGREKICFSGVQIGESNSLAEHTFAPVGSLFVSEDGYPYIVMQDSPALTDQKCVATVISNDMPILAQLGEGYKVNFSPCTIEAAQKLITVRRREFIKNYLMLNSYEI